MKKKSLLLSLILIILLPVLFFASCGKGVQEEKAELTYNKKYYYADNYSDDYYTYYEFYKDGTGIYGMKKPTGETVYEFKYYLTKDAVHCFYNGKDKEEPHDWNQWYYASKDVLYRATSAIGQYICEARLEELPNFGL